MAKYTVFPKDALVFEPRPGGDRSVARLSDALSEMRANIFRLEPGARGPRHIEGVQEEMFVALEGTITIALGDPAEDHELTEGSVAAVPAGTALQLRNESKTAAVVLAVGAPPVTGQAQHLPD